MQIKRTLADVVIVNCATGWAFRFGVMPLNNRHTVWHKNLDGAKAAAVLLAKDSHGRAFGPDGEEIQQHPELPF